MEVFCFHNLNEENGYLSNLYPSPFTIDGVTFSSMEQYMMYCKAVCFCDDTIAALILATDSDHIVKIALTTELNTAA